MPSGGKNSCSLIVDLFLNCFSVILSSVTSNVLTGNFGYLVFHMSIHPTSLQACRIGNHRKIK